MIESGEMLGPHTHAETDKTSHGCLWIDPDVCGYYEILEGHLKNMNMPNALHFINDSKLETTAGAEPGE